MSSNDQLRCFACGEFGHRAVECPDREGNGAFSTNETVQRQPPARRGQPQQQQHPQQHPQQQGHVTTQTSLTITGTGQSSMGTAHGATDAELRQLAAEFRQRSGIQDAEVVFVSPDQARAMESFVQVRGIDRFVEEWGRGRAQPNTEAPARNVPVPAHDVEEFVQVRGIDRLAERLRRDGRTRLNIGGLRDVDVPGPALATQGRAGSGMLPGARDHEHPIRAAAGPLGHYRVERPGTVQAPGGHERRGARQSAQDDNTSMASQASGSGGRLVHTDNNHGHEHMNHNEPERFQVKEETEVKVKKEPDTSS
ncbi:hypothetical protein Daus18300_013812 [Diaporthe australafricana]|uniref:CCHC-type domain-containing protein n=1 Tax=Diaporthe australafricana TaxID=127596 RepID=A0ABR3VXP1_9PEZI